MVYTEKHSCYINEDGSLGESLIVRDRTTWAFRYLAQENYDVLSFKDIVEQRVRAHKLGNEKVIEFWNHAFDTTSSVLYDLKNNSVKIVPRSTTLNNFGDDWSLPYINDDRKAPSNALERKFFDNLEGVIFSEQEFLDSREIIFPEVEGIVEEYDKIDFDLLEFPFKTIKGFDEYKSLTRDEYNNFKSELQVKKDKIWNGFNFESILDNLGKNKLWNTLLDDDKDLARKYSEMHILSNVELFKWLPFYLFQTFGTNTWIEHLRDRNYIVEEFIRLDGLTKPNGSYSESGLLYRNASQAPFGGHAAEIDISNLSCNLVGIPK